MRATSVALSSLLLVAACAGPDQEVDGDDTDLVSGEGKADGELRARVSGMTVWLDPAVTRVERDGGVVWAMRGRASRALAGAFAFVPDDPFGEAVLLDSQRFEVTLGSDHEINTMLSGLPLFVRLEPQGGGDSVFAGLWLRPSFSGFSGSSSLWVDTGLEPVWVGGQVIYRGRVSTASGFDQLWVSGANAARPEVVLEGTRQWRLDFSFDALAAAAADPAGLSIEARRGSTLARKRVHLAARVAWLGLTWRDPYEVWATECDDDVRACLDELSVGELDAEHCGSYREVARCGGAAVAAEPDREAIAADLRAQLVSHYEWNGDDILAAGGRSLAEAQALVTAGAIVRITDDADEIDPLGHDLAWTYVYRHPDPTIASSNASFWALYERRGGTLETIYYADPQ